MPSQKPCSLRPLPPSGVRGVSIGIDSRRCRYRLRIRKPGRKAFSWTHESTDYVRVRKDFLGLAERYNRGEFDPWAPNADSLSAGEALDQYERHVCRSKSPKYCTQVREVVGAFLREAGEDRPARNITRRDLQRYYLAAHRAPKTKDTYFRVLAAWLAWCKKEGIIEENPLAGEKAPRVPKPPPVYFTPEQFLAFVREAQALADEHRAKPLYGGAATSLLGDLPDLFRLAVETGMRQGELLHLRWKDVDLKRPVIDVSPYRQRHRGREVVFTVKGTDHRLVPVSPAALALLKRRLGALTSETFLVFPGTNGFPRDAGNLQKQVRRIRQRIGLGKGYSFHTLRHTYASWLAQSGISLRLLQQWMGHRSITTTEVYAHLLPDSALWQGSRVHDQLGAQASIITEV